jgi:hypothetical protein
MNQRPRGRPQGTEMTQYFSDQTLCLEPVPTPPYPDQCNLSALFDPYKSDRLGLTIKGRFVTTPSSVTLRMLSWGGGEITFLADQMTGLSDALMVSLQEHTVTSISLQKFTVSSPR